MSIKLRALLLALLTTIACLATSVAPASASVTNKQARPQITANVSAQATTKAAAIAFPSPIKIDRNKVVGTHSHIVVTCDYYKVGYWPFDRSGYVLPCNITMSPNFTKLVNTVIQEDPRPYITENMVKFLIGALCAIGTTAITAPSLGPFAGIPGSIAGLACGSLGDIAWAIARDNLVVASANGDCFQLAATIGWGTRVAGKNDINCKRAKEA